MGEVEILPSDVRSKVAALAPLDVESQTRAVTVMLSHARTGLLAAIAAHDIRGIVEFKAKAAGIAEVAKQVRLGKEMQLDAAEFVRRAERGLGVAIREGQERGEIETTAEARSRAARERDCRLGRSKTFNDFDPKPKPTDFADKVELRGNGDGNIYGMTDGINDEQFEEAIAEAKEEGNLSRANVARKAKAKAGKDRVIDLSGNSENQYNNRLDGNRMLLTLSIELEATAKHLKQVDPSTIDPESIESITVIYQSMASIKKTLKEFKK
ncbi:hypothetical protein [Tsukamurella paurometabola]|nr:hypothetical protein [Tsukamurella paurometabola]